MLILDQALEAHPGGLNESECPAGEFDFLLLLAVRLFCVCVGAKASP